MNLKGEKESAIQRTGGKREETADAKFCFIKWARLIFASFDHGYKVYMYQISKILQ